MNVSDDWCACVQNLGDKLKDAVAGAKEGTLSKVEDIKSSTGELNPAKAKAAEENNPDGTNVIVRSLACFACYGADCIQTCMYIGFQCMK